jgi:hypothetical protein
LILPTGPLPTPGLRQAGRGREEVVMEKAFALRSAIPELMTNGKIAVYSTTDRRISHLVIINSSFEWENRSKQEAFRCGRCKSFILPDEKSKSKDGVKLHKICNLKKISSKKETPNEVDNRTGTDSPAQLV